MNTRLQHIDIIKGIGIILVVLGHFAFLPNEYKIYLYSFHMPLFFFISGYLFNFAKNNNFSAFAKKKFKSLIIPYILISLVLFVYNSLVSFITNDPLNYKEYLTSLVYGNKIYEINYISTLWFLLCLFCTEVIFHRIVSIAKNENSKIILFTIILSIIGYFYGFFDLIRLPFTLDIALTAVVFYSFGYLFKNSQIKSKITSTKISILIFLIGSILFTILNFKFSSENHLVDGRIDMLYLAYGNYFLFYLAAITGIIFIYSICIFISNTNLKAIKFLGMNSLIIMSFHIPILIVVNKIVNLSPIELPLFIYILVNLILILVINSVVAIIINRYFPFLIGKSFSLKNKTPQ